MGNPNPKSHPATQFKKSDTKIAVACKVPNGIILRLFDMVPALEPVLGGGTRETKMAQLRGEPFRLKGPSVPTGKTPKFPIAGGYGITTNVPQDFFEEWLAQNADTDLVKRGLVFAASNLDRARDEAEEKETIRTGLEPLDPDHLPRSGVKGIKIESYAAE